MLGELTPDQIEQVLRSEVVGRIGCHTDGGSYVVPITYAYDGRDIFGHSGEGQKLRMMRANPAVCFEVEQIDNLANWRSVIAQGTFEELDGAAAELAMQLLVGRLAPLIASATSQPPHEGSGGHVAETVGQPAVMYRIVLNEKSGRFEKR